MRWEFYPKLAFEGMRKTRRLYIPYLLTGMLNCHPSSAIQFIKENRTDYAVFYQDLIDSAL